MLTQRLQRFPGEANATLGPVRDGDRCVFDSDSSGDSVQSPVESPAWYMKTTGQIMHVDGNSSCE